MEQVATEDLISGVGNFELVARTGHIGMQSIGMHPSTEIGLMEVGGCCLIGVSSSYTFLRELTTIVVWRSHALLRRWLL